MSHTTIRVLMLFLMSFAPTLAPWASAQPQRKPPPRTPADEMREAGDLFDEAMRNADYPRFVITGTFDSVDAEPGRELERVAIARGIVQRAKGFLFRHGADVVAADVVDSTRDDLLGALSRRDPSLASDLVAATLGADIAVHVRFAGLDPAAEIVMAADVEMKDVARAQTIGSGSANIASDLPDGRISPRKQQLVAREMASLLMEEFARAYDPERGKRFGLIFEGVPAEHASRLRGNLMRIAAIKDVARVRVRRGQNADALSAVAMLEPTLQPLELIEEVRDRASLTLQTPVSLVENTGSSAVFRSNRLDGIGKRLLSKSPADLRSDAVVRQLLELYQQLGSPALHISVNAAKPLDLGGDAGRRRAPSPAREAAEADPADEPGVRTPTEPPRTSNELLIELFMLMQQRPELRSQLLEDAAWWGEYEQSWGEINPSDIPYGELHGTIDDLIRRFRENAGRDSGASSFAHPPSPAWTIDPGALQLPQARSNGADLGAVADVFDSSAEVLRSAGVPRNLQPSFDFEFPGFDVPSLPDPPSITLPPTTPNARPRVVPGTPVLVAPSQPARDGSGGGETEETEEEEPDWPQRERRSIDLDENAAPVWVPGVVLGDTHIEDRAFADHLARWVQKLGLRVRVEEPTGENELYLQCVMRRIDTPEGSVVHASSRLVNARGAVIAVATPTPVPVRAGDVASRELAAVLVGDIADLLVMRWSAPRAYEIHVRGLRTDRLLRRLEDDLRLVERVLGVEVPSFDATGERTVVVAYAACETQDLALDIESLGGETYRVSVLSRSHNVIEVRVEQAR